jgi:membrane protein
MGGILVHSLSGYQNEEQASRPNVLKALDVLYIFWDKQKAGEMVQEIQLLNNQYQITRGLDSETWRYLRDIMMEKKIITQSDRGHYLLSRDLHSITFWQLKEWVNDEQPMASEDIDAHLDWQGNAYGLLRQQRVDQRDLLNTSLAEMYEK